jgi:2-polyprenyl-6-methoxyphenol hydroxylase-like FAD-dependent oxidoreductase
MRPDLELALLERLPDGVAVRFGAAVTKVTRDEDAATVHLADGTALTAAVVVGADGIRSRVRDAVAGEVELRRLGLHTCAFTFDDPGLHARLGRRWHLSDTLHRMAGTTRCATGASPSRAHRVAEPGLPADRGAAVLAAYAGLDAATDRALAHCPPVGRAVLRRGGAGGASRWSAGRVGLAATRARPVSLLAGQGASLAVAGGPAARPRAVDAPDARRRRSAPTRSAGGPSSRSGSGRAPRRRVLPAAHAHRAAHPPGRAALLQHPLLGHPVRARISLH